MKKLIIITLTALTILVGSFTVASAKDVLLKDQIVKDSVVAYTKNDKEYVRIIISEPRELDGVKYTVGVALMCFEQDQLENAKAFGPGDTVSCIADKGSYKGRTSYTLRAFVD